MSELTALEVKQGEEVCRLRDELARLRSEIALRDRALEWCLTEGAQRYSVDVDECGEGGICDGDGNDLEVPAELAAIISKTGGVRG